MASKEDRIRLAEESLRLISGADAVLTEETKQAVLKSRMYTKEQCLLLESQQTGKAAAVEKAIFDKYHLSEDAKRECEYMCMCDLPQSKHCEFDVTQETTLQATQRLSCATSLKIGALNFASGRHPGGGFLTGARAQEESLARSSGLYPCLAQDKCKPFYSGEALWYTHNVIVSPDVPVFRDDSGRRLKTNYNVTFITCAAPNIKAMNKQKHNLGDYLEQRIANILAAAAEHSIDVLVLGAWGCGAFGNNPTQVANTFKNVLMVNHYSVKQIVFAIPDDPESQTAWPFYSQFS